VTVAAILSPALVAALVHLAALDADVGARLDTRSTTLDTSNAPRTTRNAVAAVPTASVVVDTWELRLTGTYAPRFWTSDVETTGRSLLVDQAGEARVATHHDRPWRLEALAGGVWGRTDPLSSPTIPTTATAPGQVPTTRSLAYEELYGRAFGEVPLGPRTLVGAGASGRLSRATGTDADLLPLQRSVAGDASFARLLTERDTLRLIASGSWTATDRTGFPRTLATTATGLATWRRRFVPNLDGWLGGGATLVHSDQLVPGRQAQVEPAGELGVVWARDAPSTTAVGERLSTTLDALVRLTTFVDRYTGAVNQFVDGRLGAGWRATDTFGFAVSTTEGVRTNGDTVLARADARAMWLLRDGLQLDVGVTGVWQHERRPDRPSFVEAGVFTALSYRRNRILGAIVDTPH
jgi:hypothetical protein